MKGLEVVGFGGFGVVTWGGAFGVVTLGAGGVVLGTVMNSSFIFKNDVGSEGGVVSTGKYVSPGVDGVAL